MGTGKISEDTLMDDKILGYKMALLAKLLDRPLSKQEQEMLEYFLEHQTEFNGSVVLSTVDFSKRYLYEGRPYNMYEIWPLKEDVNRNSKLYERAKAHMESFLDIELPKPVITIKDILTIEQILGFSLHGWQIDYISHERDDLPKGRGNGKTLAYILRLILDTTLPPLDLYRSSIIRSVMDIPPQTTLSHPSYAAWFYDKTKDLYQKLKKEHIPLRTIYFTAQEAKDGAT